MSLEADEAGGRLSSRKLLPSLPSSLQLNSRSLCWRESADHSHFRRGGQLREVVGVSSDPWKEVRLREIKQEVLQLLDCTRIAP